MIKNKNNVITKTLLINNLCDELRFLDTTAKMYSYNIRRYHMLNKACEDTIECIKTCELLYIINFKIRFLKDLITKIMKIDNVTNDIHNYLAHKNKLFMSFAFEINNFNKKIDKINNTITDDEYMCEFKKIMQEWKNKNREIIDEYLFELEKD